jgi:hypothetical protein
MQGCASTLVHLCGSCHNVRLTMCSVHTLRDVPLQLSGWSQYAWNRVPMLLCSLLCCCTGLITHWVPLLLSWHTSHKRHCCSYNQQIAALTRIRCVWVWRQLPRPDVLTVYTPTPVACPQAKAASAPSYYVLTTTTFRAYSTLPEYHSIPCYPMHLPAPP